MRRQEEIKYTTVKSLYSVCVVFKKYLKEVTFLAILNKICMLWAGHSDLNNLNMCTVHVYLYMYTCKGFTVKVKHLVALCVWV